MNTINVSDMTEFDLRAEAAECIRQHREATGQWPNRVLSWSEWERVGAVRGQKDGCTLIEGIKREGYVHPYANLTNPGLRGKQINQLTLKLTDEQKAERALAWSQCKGMTVVESLRYLGFVR